MSGIEAGSECALSVRPESVRLVRADQGSITGEVTRAVYYGSKVEYEIKIGTGPIIVEVYNPQLSERFYEGDRVSIALDDACVRILK